MITITDLHKQFHNLHVLKGISLTVEKGKVQIGEVKLDFSQ